MTSGGAAGSGGPAPAATGAPPGKTVPRDIVVMQAMLRELGINRFDPRILCQMHEYVYRKSLLVSGRWISGYMFHELIFSIQDTLLPLQKKRVSVPSMPRGSPSTLTMSN